MKTLFVTAFLAVAIGACSSDSNPSVATKSTGTVQQGGACKASSDCESPLACAFALNAPGGACKAGGTCVAMGPCSYVNVCSCDGKSVVQSCVSGTFTTAPTASVTTSTCGGAPASDAGTGGGG